MLDISELNLLLGKLTFRHQSPNYFTVLKPINYNDLTKQRENPEYIEDRIKNEKQYHEILGNTDPEMSFLYATIVKFHKMDSPLSYPGYTYYFHLNFEQIEKTIFSVVYGNKSTKPMKGLRGLVKALKIWNKYKNQFKSYEDSLIGQIDPRIEVIISYPVEYFKFIPQEEDR